MSHLNLAQTGWLAGMIDGEGCINLQEKFVANTKRSLIYQLSLGIRMTHELTISKIFKLASTGRLDSPRIHPGNRKVSHCWIANGKEALFVLNLVKEHLVTKREQMLLAFRFGEIYPIDRRGEISEEVQLEVKSIYNKLADLNYRGI